MSKQQTNLAENIQASVKQAVSKIMSYRHSNLNGWDYVVAVTQRHVNGGLALLYDGGHLPKSFAKKESILGVEVEFKGGFGKPTVQAISDGLKLCDLILPLENATMQTPMGPTRIPHGATLRITTSLVAMEAKIVKGRGKVYDVFVDIKNENAAYNVSIDGLPKDQIAIIESLLKKELQALTGREYLLTTYTLDDQGLGGYIPRLVDFSFVLNEEDPDASPFVLACAMDDTGPTVENRLVFTTDVLPEGLPAALWLGHQHFMGDVLLPKIREAVRRSFRDADFTYNGRGKIGLKKPFFVETIKDTGQTFDVYMKNLDFRASGGQLKVYCMIDVKGRSGLSLNAEGRSWGHVEIDVSKDRKSFRATSVVERDDVKIYDTRELWEKIITLGFVDLIRVFLKRTVKNSVKDSMAERIGPQLKEMARDINKLAANTSSLQSLNFDGNLLFDRFHLHDGGDVCIGIVGTKRN